jgi:hypothetical protein
MHYSALSSRADNPFKSRLPHFASVRPASFLAISEAGLMLATAWRLYVIATNRLSEGQDRDCTNLELNSAAPETCGAGFGYSYVRVYARKVIHDHTDLATRAKNKDCDYYLWGYVGPETERRPTTVGYKKRV